MKSEFSIQSTEEDEKDRNFNIKIDTDNTDIEIQIYHPSSKADNKFFTFMINADLFFKRINQIEKTYKSIKKGGEKNEGGICS